MLTGNYPSCRLWPVKLSYHQVTFGWEEEKPAWVKLGPFSSFCHVTYIKHKKCTCGRPLSTHYSLVRMSLLHYFYRKKLFAVLLIKISYIEPFTSSLSGHFPFLHLQRVKYWQPDYGKTKLEIWNEYTWVIWVIKSQVFYFQV